MKKNFPLFNTPIDFAHQLWKSLLADGDTVIDATCGNGHDSLMLAKELQKKQNTHLICFDIQKPAIEATKKLLLENVQEFFPSIELKLDSHENLPALPNIKLVVYNLGYLPGGDKSLTTKLDTTLSSIKKALELITPGGVISITCYPGHEEGAIEEEKLLELTSTLSQKEWSVTSFSWQNRRTAPSLLLIQKALT